MEENNFFLLLCILSFLDSTGSNFFIPILPDFLSNQGISSSLVGVILSFFFAGVIICSMYLSRFMSNHSKKSLLVIAQLLLILSSFGFSVLSQDLSNTAIISLAFIFRFIQGVSYSLMITVVNCDISTLYPKNSEKYFALQGIWFGIGLSLGPILGGYLYQFISYSWSFVILGIFYFLMSGIILPKILKYQEELERVSETEKASQPIITSPLRTLKNKNTNFSLTIIVYLFSLGCYAVIQPNFAEHMRDYTDQAYVVGIMFGLTDFSYAMSGFIVSHILDRFHFKRKTLLLFGGSLSMSSLLIMGPEEYTFLPKNFITITFGVVLLGSSQMIYIPLFIPEVCDILNNNDPNSMETKEIASSLLWFTISMSSILGLIFGGFLADYFGFNRGMTLYALLLSAILVIYAIFRKDKIKFDQMAEIECTLIPEKSKI